MSLCSWSWLAPQGSWGGCGRDNASNAAVFVCVLLRATSVDSQLGKATLEVSLGPGKPSAMRDGAVLRLQCSPCIRGTRLVFASAMDSRGSVNLGCSIRSTLFPAESPWGFPRHRRCATPPPSHGSVLPDRQRHRVTDHCVEQTHVQALGAGTCRRSHDAVAATARCPSSTLRWCALPT